MTEAESPIVPTRINLHQKSRLLEMGFSDGSEFNYPCEYLRVFAEALSAEDPPVHGKQRVNIAQLDVEDESALRLTFDDGFDDRYTWMRLHELGMNLEPNWRSYLQRIESLGLAASEVQTSMHIRLLYFIQLAKVSGKDEETIEVPASVSTVETLLAWLRTRGEDWNQAFADDRVQVTINKSFAENYTLIEDGDEVALVPRPR